MEIAVWIVLAGSLVMLLGVGVWSVAVLRSVPGWIEELGREEREEDEPGWSP